jgi:hypothetical protein
VSSWPQDSSFVVKWRWRSLCDTVQKAALEALTIFCGRHPDAVASTAAKVIPVLERHTCWRCILVHQTCLLHFGLDFLMELTFH